MTVKTTPTALEIVLDAAAEWANKLSQYIAPINDSLGDHESADAQRAQADGIIAAIAELTEKESRA